MNNCKNLGNNIIKLEGYGLYVTYIYSNIYVCDIVLPASVPILDPDGCIEWTELKDPPNQKFLNLVNAEFGTCFTMSNFGKPMSLTDIKEHAKVQKALKEREKPMTDGQARWFVKTMREKNK